MKITIRQPLCFTAQGRKDCQEDSLYPRLGEARTADKYFLVCDGVGGSDHGEVASNTVTQAIGDFLNSRELPDGLLTENIFNLALGQAYDALDGAYARYADSFKKMATTLTFLGIHRGGCLIAHIGDSRVYHIRPGVGILLRTNDHSLVNDLLKAGELTPEQAKNFKQKNVITRAMQPLMENRDRAEFTPVLQVEAGDYFFLCCDGVLEHLGEEKLVEILSKEGMTDADKLAAIKKVCDDGNTRDNYTCYLVPIDTVESEPDFDATLVEEEVVASVAPESVTASVEGGRIHGTSVPVPPISEEQISIPPVNTTVSHAGKARFNRPAPAPKKGSSISAKTIAIVLFLLLIACVAFIIITHFKSDPEKAAPAPASELSSDPTMRSARPRSSRQGAPVRHDIRVETDAPAKPGAATPTKEKVKKPDLPVDLNGNETQPEGKRNVTVPDNNEAQQGKLNSHPESTTSGGGTSGGSQGGSKPHGGGANSEEDGVKI